MAAFSFSSISSSSSAASVPLFGESSRIVLSSVALKRDKRGNNNAKLKLLMWRAIIGK